MFLIIDNYDSFVHNLARYVELAGVKYEIIRNDAITIEGIKAIAPEAILLSPGPCTPGEAGICIETVQKLGPTTPILGVCLGHQAIGEAYGGQTIQTAPMHGKSSTITHDETGLFTSLPSPLTVGRYHSLITQDTNLQITARAEDGTPMAFAHPSHPVHGVQFHPESILTQHGLKIIQNFRDIAIDFNQRNMTTLSSSESCAPEGMIGGSRASSTGLSGQAGQ